jgi:hypothetical protein
MVSCGISRQGVKIAMPMDFQGGGGGGGGGGESRRNNLLNFQGYEWSTL